MPKVLHVIQGLSCGGAARAMISVVKYASRLDSSFTHRVLAISYVDPEAAALAAEVGMEVIQTADHQDIFNEMEQADLVHVQWWNCPELQLLFRDALPPTRLISWFHVAGDKPPQIVDSKLVNFVDFAMACSPHTFNAPGIQALEPSLKAKKAGIVYGPADFERVQGLTPRVPSKQDNSFNVGYIGTVHYLKMHQHFVRMSSSVDIPDVKFVVCGVGDVERCIEDAKKLGTADRFDFKGYVNDIRSVIATLDVYGYPLCEDTYAASEVNLQEVMYVGLPVVVFPYGGVKLLVKHNETGLIVHSEQEYKEAIEFLYYNPSERLRLGKNASDYAKQVFGAQNAATTLVDIYRKLLTQPKRLRVWGKDVERPLLEQELALADVCPIKMPTGAEIFIESLVDPETSSCFERSLRSNDLNELFIADEEIANFSELMTVNGVGTYRNYFRTDGALRLWSALGHWARDRCEVASGEFLEAMKLGNNHWRVAWYLSRALEKLGYRADALGVLKMVLDVMPTFEPAQELRAKLSREVASSSNASV